MAYIRLLSCWCRLATAFQLYLIWIPQDITGCSKHVEMWMRKDEPTTGARWNEINWRVSCASVSQKTLLQIKQCCESCNGTCSWGFVLQHGMLWNGMVVITRSKVLSSFFASDVPHVVSPLGPTWCEAVAKGSQVAPFWTWLGLPCGPPCFFLWSICSNRAQVGANWPELGASYGSCSAQLKAKDGQVWPQWPFGPAK